VSGVGLTRAGVGLC